MKRSLWKRAIIPVTLFILFLLLCEFLISNDDNCMWLNEKIEEKTGWYPGFSSIPESMLPRPSKVLKILFVTPKNGRGGLAYFWKHTKATLYGSGIGFLIGNIAAILMATLFLYNKSLEKVLMPIALTLRSMPLVALTPLLLRIRFTLTNVESVQNSAFLYKLVASEDSTKALIVTILMFFPTLVNVAQGLNSVPTNALELMDTYNASKWQVYWKLRVPYALPLTFAALKIATSAAVMGVIVAEWLSSSEGLGYVIYRSYGLSQVTRMMAAMIISCVISVITFIVVGWIEDLVIPWAKTDTEINTAETVKS